MIYEIILLTTNDSEILNLIQKLPFRIIFSNITSLFLVFSISKPIVKLLNKKCIQPIRLNGPKSHLINKKKTPTMGGIIIIISTFGGTLLWADIHNIYVNNVLFVTAVYGCIGFIDDYTKIKKKILMA